MKTVKILTFAAIALFSKTSVFAETLNTAGTYTFVDPCQPFGMISPVPNTYGCFSFTAANGGAYDPGQYYSWNFGDGTTATGTNVLHCYSPVTVTTVYTVVLSYYNGACGFSPMQQTQTISIAPPAQGLCVQNSPSVTLAAKSVTVWAGIAIPEIINKYHFGDGTVASNSNTHTYATCGNYIITAKHWDMNQPQDTCYAYAAVNMTCATTNPPPTTGINDQDGRMFRIKIFPNPASNELKIVSEKAISGIKIVDILGKESLPDVTHNSSETSISLSGLVAGAYFAKIGFKDGSEKTIRFIKQ